MEILVVEHEADGGLGHFDEWLRAGGIEPVVVRPYAGDPVPARAGAGLIVLGGAVGAYDDDEAPWLPATRDLLRRAVDANVPVLGICLGAQLLTVACGGRVERAADGPEVGAVPVKLDGADPLFRAIDDPAWFVQWHFDVMAELPPGAVPLGRSAAYPHQAYRLGDRAWAVQFHPEVTFNDVTTWARHTDGTAGIDAAAVLAEINRRRPEIRAAAATLAANFAGIVRDAP